MTVPEGDQMATAENWSIMAIQYTQWDQPRLLASLYFRGMNSSLQWNFNLLYSY